MHRGLVAFPSRLDGRDRDRAVFNDNDGMQANVAHDCGCWDTQGVIALDFGCGLSDLKI